MSRRWWIIAGASILMAWAALPQDLAPEVLLLSRIKRHLRDELARTPNYTCLETIARFRDDPRSGVQLRKRLNRLDTVQLEIVYTDGHEWYGSPGARDLNEDHPSRFVGVGMMGNGAFGITLHNLVQGGVFTYRGEEDLDGLRTVRYDYRVARMFAPLIISLDGGIGTVGELGSIWVDPETLDLIRVQSHADDIPPSLPLQEETSTVNYARVRIGDSDTLLAQQADSRMLEDNGVESYNRIDFTHCRSYGATSAIKFEAEPVGPAPATSAPAVPPGAGDAVPAFLEVTVLLTTPISDKDAVGTLIQGKISGNVVHKGKVVAPDGAVVHGRIRALEHYPDRGVFGIGLEFTEVDAGGQTMPFYADFLRTEKNPAIQPVLAEQLVVAGTRGKKQISMPELPGVATFFIKGTEFTLPAGFRMVWRTRGILHIPSR